jgi:predicted amidophosphoribosyltransferase
MLATTPSGHSFLCLDCRKSTAVNPLCPSCGERAELLQARKTFFLRCSRCAHERVFFVNPTAAPQRPQNQSNATPPVSAQPSP